MKKLSDKSGDTVARYDTNQVTQLFPKVYLLVKNTINQLNNDFELVANSVQLFLTCYQLREIALNNKNNNKRHDMTVDLRERHEQMITLLGECLKQKCSKSIIINYGIDINHLQTDKWHQTHLEETKRKQSNKFDNMNRNRNRHSNDKAIHFFENECIDLDGEDDFEDMRSTQRQTPKLFKNFIGNIATNIAYMFGRSQEKAQEFENTEPNVTIETNEEALLFSYLLNVQTPPFKSHSSRYESNENYESQIMQFLNSRLSKATFYELIMVRSLFKFDSVRTNRKNILPDQFNKILMEKLSQNEDTNIEILCKCLEKNEPLLQFFINALLNDKINDHRCLEFVLETGTFTLILEQSLLARKRNKANPLDKSMEARFSKCLELFNHSLENIVRGDESLYVIKLFYENATIFSHLFEILQRENLIDKKKDVNSYRALFLFRMREVTAYEKYKVSMKAFLQFCSHFKQINIKVYEKKLEELTPIKEEELKLSKVCKCIEVNQMNKYNNVDLYSSEIICFADIKTKEIKVINEIISLDRLKCILFDYYFNETCNEVLQSKTAGTPKEILVHTALFNVYPATLAKWKAFAEIIENGSIKLMKIDELLSKFFANNFNKLYDEFYYICSMHKIVNMREQMDRVDRYNRFKSSVDLAKSIEEIRKSLKMTKNFNEIKDLLNIKSEEFKDWTILKMDSKVETTIQILNRMSSSERQDNEKLKCLKAFVDSVELVQWLRTNIKDIKELKYFVEIVSTTKPSDIQNQNSNRALLPKTLKEAGIAFAPLIFDLKTDDGFEKFMGLCQTVWSHLENDKKISQKLIALKDEIPVLEAIRVKKSNVELSAINQAKQFNEIGIYQIGFSKKK